MGFEMMSVKKPTIFLDPFARNTAHLPNENFYKDIKAISYEEFENFVIKNLNNTKHQSTLNSDDYCLDSKNTIEKAFKILMENLKKKKNN